MGQQVTNGHRQIVVGVHQSRGRGDDPMPVGIRVVSKSHAVLILETNKPGHRVRAGTVHANLAVVINRHEGECCVELLVNDADIQFVNGIDWLPVRQRGAAERVNGQLQAGRANRIQVDDVTQILDIGYDIV